MRDEGRAAGASGGDGREDAAAALHFESPALEARLREARAQRAAALARKQPPRFASGLAARLGRARPGLGVGAERGEADPPRLAAIGSEDTASAFDTYPARPLRRGARPPVPRRGSVLLAAGLAFAAGAALTLLAMPFFRSDVPTVVVIPETAPAVQEMDATAAVTSEPAASSQTVAGSPVRAPEAGSGAIVAPAAPAVDALALAPAAEAVAPLPAEVRPAVEAESEQEFAPASGGAPEAASAPEALPMAAVAPVGGAMPEGAPEIVPEGSASLEAAAPESGAAPEVTAPETEVVAVPAAPVVAATLRAAPPPPRPQGLASQGQPAAAAREAAVAAQPSAAPVVGAALPAPDASAALPLFSGAGQPPAAFEDAPRADPGIAVWLPEQPTARPAAKSRRRSVAPAPAEQPQKRDNLFSAARRDLSNGFRRLDSGFSAAARRVERGFGLVLPGPSKRPAGQPKE